MQDSFCGTELTDPVSPGITTVKPIGMHVHACMAAAKAVLQAIRM